MADGEHLASQTRNIWLADKSRPYEGTEKHPQGRLFAPTGGYTGDPWKLSPENWLKQGDTSAHSDVISWHGSEDSSLPRSDDYEHRASDESDFEGADWNNPFYDDEGEENEDYRDWSVDSKDRPMTNYGSAVGMHFGDIKAVTDRSRKASDRPFIHPARLPEETMAPPPRGGFSTERPGGSIAGGLYRSGRDIINSETGEREVDQRWGDSAANYSEKATDLVERGKTLAYRNDVEAEGSTSYRTLPETARTWSEDVMQARNPLNGRPASEKYGWSGDEHAFRNKPHPALVHLAEQGYDPVVLGESKPSWANESVQMSFDDLTRSNVPGGDSLETIGRERALKQSISRNEHFNAGRDAVLRKPTS